MKRIKVGFDCEFSWGEIIWIRMQCYANNLKPTTILFEINSQLILFNSARGQTSVCLNPNYGSRFGDCIFVSKRSGDVTNQFYQRKQNTRC